MHIHSFREIKEGGGKILQLLLLYLKHEIPFWNKVISRTFIPEFYALNMECSENYHVPYYRMEFHVLGITIIIILEKIG